MNHLLLFLALYLNSLHDASSPAVPVNMDGDPTPCYAAYAGKVDKLLTLEDVRAEYPSLPAETEHQYLTSLPVYLQASEYLWPGDRTDTVSVGGRTYAVAKSNRIGIGGLEIYTDEVKDPKAKFQNTYRTPTEEEKAEYQKRLQEKMEEEGRSESQRKAEYMATTLFDHVKFMPVEGIGDAAAWDIKESALVILVARAKFKVIADISDDPAVNIDLAKRLARRVFRKC